ncbi:MAG: hypothetical protein GF390_02240 [Candidatus Pacebacteria bacterium]|nr:hypothetical protein [Candidatus Paceibacterota bacterium]
MATKNPRKRRSSKISKSSAKAAHPVFLPLILVVLALWVVYRSLFNFPVWFDETIGKALFFGLPVWVYIVISNLQEIPNSLASFKLKRGLSLGLAIGGLYGFAATTLAVYQRGSGVQPAALFMADRFWWEFALALLTAFWETLFFYSFVMTVVQHKFTQWSLLKQLLLVVGIFMAFHLPNTILRFGAFGAFYQVILLSLFALGQGYLFASEKNAYALILSHAIWGMVLLIHF